MIYFPFPKITASKENFPAPCEARRERKRKKYRGISKPLLATEKPLLKCTVTIATSIIIMRGTVINLVKSPRSKKRTPIISTEAVNSVINGANGILSELNH